MVSGLCRVKSQELNKGDIRSQSPPRLEGYFLGANERSMTEFDLIPLQYKLAELALKLRARY